MNYAYNHSIVCGDKYIPTAGGEVTFTLISERTFRRDDGTTGKQYASIRRVFSPNKNFILRSFSEKEDFSYEVVANFKPLSQVIWESAEACRKGEVPIYFEVYEESTEQNRLFMLYLQYLGELQDYFYAEPEEYNIASTTVNVQVVSFKEVTNNQAIRLSVTPEIETTDSENITAALVEKPTVNTPLTPFKFSLTLSRPVAEISGVSFNAETNEYTLPVTIRQKEYTYDKTNAPITPETAKFINYNLIFKS